MISFRQFYVATFYNLPVDESRTARHLIALKNLPP